MSPATRAYLDMKYDAATPVGGTWAGFIDERRRLRVGPGHPGARPGRGRRAGRRGPALVRDASARRKRSSYLAFPRLAGYAEIAWSPPAGRTWDEYRTRIGTHGPRLTAMGVNVYRSAAIPWR